MLNCTKGNQTDKTREPAFSPFFQAILCYQISQYGGGNREKRSSLVVFCYYDMFGVFDLKDILKGCIRERFV
jgi:hypothetical protein